jgi:hypothetical protein
MRCCVFAMLAAGGGWSAPAAAGDWGCEVLLCLSNPGGPTQYAACVPPIDRLWARLALGGSFPTCAGGGVTGAEVRDRSSATRRHVTMTFSDGHRQDYPLVQRADGAVR